MFGGRDGASLKKSEPNMLDCLGFLLGFGFPLEVLGTEADDREALDVLRCPLDFPVELVFEDALAFECLELIDDFRLALLEVLLVDLADAREVFLDEDFLETELLGVFERPLFSSPAFFLDFASCALRNPEER